MPPAGEMTKLEKREIYRKRTSLYAILLTVQIRTDRQEIQDGTAGCKDAEAEHAHRRWGSGAPEDQERQRLRGDPADEQGVGGPRARGDPRARQQRPVRCPLLPEVDDASL